MKIKEKRMVIGLILFSLFLHIYKLGSVPRGIYVDEMGMGYDAWCIGTYGVDRYLKSLPFYLTNFGGGQSILYCYLDIIFVKLWGINAVTLRIPAVIFSMITCICGYRIIVKQWNRKVGILYLALFCLVPYFTMSGRIGLDCNLMLGMSVLFLDFLQQAVLTGKNGWYLAAGFAAGITFYTYALTYLILPVFLVLLCVYLFYIRKINLQQVIRMMLPAVVLALPLLVVQIINIFDLPELKIGCFTFTKLIQYRGNELNISCIKDNLRALYDSLFAVDITEFDNFAKYSNLYIVSIPFLIIGGVESVLECIDSIRNKCFDMAIPVVAFAGLEVLLSCFITGVTTYRVNALFFPLLYFLVIGIKSIWNAGQRWSKPLLGIAAAVYLCSFAGFAYYYFEQYPAEVYPQRLFGDDMSQAVHYLQEQPDKIQDRVTYIGGVNEAYIYYLGSMYQSPYEYNMEAHGNIGNEKFQFYYPDELTEDANYIVYAARKEYIEAMSAAGFTCVRQGEYVVGTYEWEDYEQITDQNGVIQSTWDVKREDGDSFLVSGWCVNQDADNAWDCMLLNLDGEWIRATRFDREDVVEATNNADYLQSGVSFEIPMDLWQQADEIELFCISHDDRKCYIQKMKKQDL